MLRKRWCGQIYLVKFSPIRKQRHENVLVYSGPHFCPSSWSVLSQENIFGKPQESQGSNPNITLGTNAVTCRQNFYGQIHRSRCGRQTTKLPWIYNGLFAALSLIAFSQTSLENLADWLKFKLISLIKRRQKRSCNWGKYWKKINPKNVECYSPAKSSITSLLWCLPCNAKHYSFWGGTNFIIFFKSSSNFSLVRMPPGSPM